MNDQPPQSGPSPDRPPADPAWLGEPPHPQNPTQPGPVQPGPAFEAAQAAPTFGAAQPGPALEAAPPGPAFGGAPPAAPYPGNPAGPYPGNPAGPYPGNPAGPYPGYPAGPYAGYPAPPGGPGYPGPPVSTGTNGFAITSLIFGILGGVLFSVIFGIVALVQLRTRRQGGRGLAIGGLIASGCWVLVIAAGLTYGIVSGADDDTRSDGTVAVTTLTPGDCLKTVQETGSVEDLPVVPCTTPHEGEVFAVFDLANGPWPGDTAVQQEAEDRCNDEFEAYVSVPDEQLEVLYLHPLQQSWWLDRGVTCIATDPRGPRTSSLRG